MNSTLPRAAFAFLLLSLAGGCASNTKSDPLEPLNRGIYRFNDTLDKAVVKPVATAYKDVAPQPVQTGVSNFFGNLNDMLISLNDLLQLKVSDAVSDGGRVLLNTSFGMFGLVDIASQAGMPKHNEDFGQTLGRWGIGNGPFLMLPLFGPSTLRDSAGLLVDSGIEPLKQNIDNVPQRNRAYALRMVQRRALLLDASRVLEDAALDPYQFLRDAYLQQRRSKVYDGNPPPQPEENGNGNGAGKEDEGDFAEDPAPLPAAAAAAPTPIRYAAADNPPSTQPAKPTLLRLWLPAGGR